MAFCSSIGFLAVRVLGLVKSHNMTAEEYLKRVMPIGARPRDKVPAAEQGSRRGAW